MRPNPPHSQVTTDELLANAYATLGEARRAIDLSEQALAVARDIGHRQGEAAFLCNLGDSYVDRDDWKQAIQHYGQAIRIADEIGIVQQQSDARSGLAKAQLLSGDLSAARQAAEAARSFDYPPNYASVSATLGVALLRQGHAEPARLAFTEAIAQADSLLEHTSEDYGALDSKALALCGLALLGDVARLPEARSLSTSVRQVSREIAEAPPMGRWAC
jgi:tetratricopeptide (TPR) repeat protein